MLSSLLKLSCEVCLVDINEFYDDSFDIVALNQIILSKAVSNHHGSKLLAPGRVVILHDEVFCLILMDAARLNKALPAF